MRLMLTLRGNVQLQNIASAISSAVIGVRPWLNRSFFAASPPKRTSMKSVSVRPGSMLVTRTFEPRTSARRFNANCFERFAGSIHIARGKWIIARDRAEQHDVSFISLQHACQQSVHSIEHPIDVGRYHILPIGYAGLLRELHADPMPGVGDHDVDAAKRLGQARDRLLNWHAIPNIKRGNAAGFTEFGLERFEAIGTASGCDYLGSRTNEAAACSFADPRGGSGHERSEHLGIEHRNHTCNPPGERCLTERRAPGEVSGERPLKG